MKPYILVFMLLWTGFSSRANNIQLSNLATTFNSSTGVVTADFDLSWENSWRTTAINNWDAAWVFFKYNDGGIWYHLELTGFDITLPSGFTYSVPADKKGIFIYRDGTNLGVGNVTLTGCKVGVQPQLGSFDLKAFALEMVYVPIGGFYVGDGATTGSYKDGSSNNPYYVQGGQPYVSLGTNSGQLNTGGGNTTTLHSNYPTGYFPFYCMKYELSTGAFRDFMNCLSVNQQLKLVGLTSNTFLTSLARPVGESVFPSYSPINNYICFETPGSATSPAQFACNANGNSTYNEVNDGESVAMGGMSVETMLMYLVFSGLRPMTDLEFEKAARGPLQPIAGQYAWGNTLLISTGTPTLSNALRSNESISGGTLNTNLASSFNRPLRNGIFANSTSSRVSSGASYYGIMELTGNLCELVYNSNHSSVSTFSGSHGNGNLNQLATVNSTFLFPWGYFVFSIYLGNNSIVTGIGNYLAKGGSFNNSAFVPSNYGAISQLTQIQNTMSSNNPLYNYESTASVASGYTNQHYGIRGVRTAE